MRCCEVGQSLLRWCEEEEEEESAVQCSRGTLSCVRACVRVQMPFPRLERATSQPAVLAL